MVDYLSRLAYRAPKVLAHMSMHAGEAQTVEAKRIIELEEGLERGGAHCFFIMAQQSEDAQTEPSVSFARQKASVVRERQAAIEASLRKTKATPLTSCIAEDWLHSLRGISDCPRPPCEECC